MGGAVLGQEGLHFEAFQRKGHMSGDFGGEHKFMSEALEVNAQNLLSRKNFNKAKNYILLSVSNKKNSNNLPCLFIYKYNYLGNLYSMAVWYYQLRFFIMVARCTEESLDLTAPIRWLLLPLQVPEHIYQMAANVIF